MRFGLMRFSIHSAGVLKPSLSLMLTRSASEEVVQSFLAGTSGLCLFGAPQFEH
jgi:hypothetical protein